MPQAMDLCYIHGRAGAWLYAGAAPQEQADLLGWDTDDDYQPQPSSSLPHDAFGQQHPSHQNGLPSSMPTFHQQTAAGGPPSAPWAAPVGYPTRPPGSANAGRAGPELMASPAVALQSQAWGSSNAAGLKELQLAPDQSAALQEYVGRSLMDDHMDMAGTGSHLPPAMDISPLTPHAPAEPLAAAGPGFHNALVLYEPLAGRAPLTSVMGGWHQPGIIPSMARFDGPQHQMSFEDSTDFSQPFAAQPWGSQPAYGSATSDPAAFSQSHMQQSQQPGQISMGVAGVPQGSTPAPVTAGGPRLQPQQPQAAVDTAPQVSCHCQSLAFIVWLCMTRIDYESSLHLQMAHCSLHSLCTKHYWVRLPVIAAALVAMIAGIDWHPAAAALHVTAI